MLKFTRVLATPVDRPDFLLTLPYAYRNRSRQKVRFDSGEEAGLFLPRGTVLKDNDFLGCEEGLTVRIIAKKEQLSQVKFSDHLQMAKICFHLGNRHVPLQIDNNRVCYKFDPVVDEMLRGMGYTIELTEEAFHPESGAYHLPEIKVAW
ncbi:urease accessory protein UreE [Maridesulfovibrio bastinii]|uniref:urease accessory protein UreE n=1 Tax=Maridesulfovibrio bastinii TaxID=47157 RepID=UPI000427CF19|nr:urease accessory protein UreE [Maridesulfovibrio bastinii]